MPRSIATAISFVGFVAALVAQVHTFDVPTPFLRSAQKQGVRKALGTARRSKGLAATRATFGLIEVERESVDQVLEILRTASLAGFDLYCESFQFGHRISSWPNLRRDRRVAP